MFLANTDPRPRANPRARELPCRKHTRGRRSRGSPPARRGRLRAPDRAVSRRVAGALLPDARLRSRRRGRAPGGASAGLAWVAAVRGQKLASLMALPHRHERLPDDDRATAETSLADRLRSGERPERPSRTTARGARLARALPRRGTRS